MTTQPNGFVRAAPVAEVRARGCVAVAIGGHTLALFAHGDEVYAVDNRCPHMGFPLDRGTVRDGLLTCHWHHARFDLATGGTFDLFADDVPVFPVEIRGDEVWVDLAPRRDPHAHHLKRVHDGMAQAIPLVIAKAVIALNAAGDRGDGLREAFAAGLDFGARYRRAGWGQGLTMLACFANLLPHLDPEDRPLAMYHGLSAVAVDTADSPPRFPLEPLPGTAPDLDTLKRWFRRFVEVRDGEGTERCLVTAVRAGAGDQALADMLFAAATDHRYVQIGHVADFTNKVLEALDRVGWESPRAELVLTSLADGYVNATRMEESNAWRNPIDLVALLETAFDALPGALEARASKRETRPTALPSPLGGGAAGDGLIPTLLADDPHAIVDALLDSLREGATGEQLAGAVAYAAALRIAQFPVSNEFTDWDTALHTFTFANAVHQGLRRMASPAEATRGSPPRDVPPLLRGVFDAAMSVYLDRFLNIPAARLPAPDGRESDPESALAEFPALLDRQQMVEEAGAVAARQLGSGGDPARLLAMLGKMLLREDRDFHTIQTVEAAFRQFAHQGGAPAGAHVLVAAARYLAAHSPTVRAEGQTYQIARRLHRGEKLFEEG